MVSYTTTRRITTIPHTLSPVQKSSGGMYTQRAANSSSLSSSRQTAVSIAPHDKSLKLLQYVATRHLKKLCISYLPTLMTPQEARSPRPIYRLCTLRRHPCQASSNLTLPRTYPGPQRETPRAHGRLSMRMLLST